MGVVVFRRLTPQVILQPLECLPYCAQVIEDEIGQIVVVAFGVEKRPLVATLRLIDDA